jgi:hypothetical protein
MRCCDLGSDGPFIECGTKMVATVSEPSSDGQAAIDAGVPSWTVWDARERRKQGLVADRLDFANRSFDERDLAAKIRVRPRYVGSNDIEFVSKAIDLRETTSVIDAQQLSIQIVDEHLSVLRTQPRLERDDLCSVERIDQGGGEATCSHYFDPTPRVRHALTVSGTGHESNEISCRAIGGGQIFIDMDDLGRTSDA